ncbi:hypothetical protein LWI29_033983 [Acer saccharum]|uniref:XPG-I domain-containing protein n=1 Tax=Acer saccharum TaxID=4024 RepID=A0AA39VH43_ACESA|nr:hypothetical protein LWI29_033983 [Acer saccharum]
MHRVNLLRHYGVKPVLVFDGGLLPMKIEQENKRARARKENLARAIERESDGNSSAAYEFYQKAVDISPSIAHELIQVLKQENVCYVVAPYEADAQMTFLAISKQVDAVITEDSDLIAFGCPRIIFKMDKFGQGVEFQYSMLPKNKALSFAGFTEQMLLEMCILSGCDYLPSLPGMGLKRAHALISFASLEAKRKFSAPRISPQNTSPEDTFSLSSGELAAVEAGSSEKNCSLASPVSSENVGNVSPLNNSEKSCFASEVPLFSESMIPGLALQKEFEIKNLTDAAEGKTRKDSRKVIVRSSYFQHKQVNKNDQGNEQEIVLVKDDDALQKGCERKNLMDVAEGKTGKANRKVIIRSPYFQPKQVNKNDQENEQEKLLVKDYDATDQENKQEKLVIEVDVASDMSENVNTENSLSASYPKCTTLKRKASANNSVQTENARQKQVCTNEPLNSNGYCDPNLDKTFPERENNEGKFGSNISHLGRYSEIAEKSVERFVSVISSYRYSSGSRASGLRAPLRDVRNTCTNRISLAEHSCYCFRGSNIIHFSLKTDDLTQRQILDSLRSLV